MMHQIDWEEVTEEDLPEDLREIGRAMAGAQTPVEAAGRLVELWGGDSLYVPALRHLRRQSLARRARRLWDPTAHGGRGNAASVCRQLGLSRRHLSRLLEG